MESRIKIKLGPVEVEYEGSEKFLVKELPELLGAISKLYKESIPHSDADELTSLSPHKKGKVGTTSAIASKLGAKSGPDLAKAGAAHLTLGKGKESFTREELLKEMKTAKSFYKSSYLSNLTVTLNNLVKGGHFNEISADTYALSDATAKEIEGKVAS